MELRDILYRFIYDDKSLQQDMNRLDSVLEKTKQDAGEAATVVESLYEALADTPDIEADIEDETIDESIIVPVRFELDDVPKADFDGPDESAESSSVTPQSGITTPIQDSIREVDDDDERSSSVENFEENIRDDSSISVNNENILDAVPGEADVNAGIYPEFDSDTEAEFNTEIDGTIANNEHRIDNNFTGEIQSNLESGINNVVEKQVDAHISNVNNNILNKSVKQNRRDVQQEDEGSTQQLDLSVELQGGGSAKLDVEKSAIPIDHKLELASSISIDDQKSEIETTLERIGDSIKNTENILNQYESNFEGNVSSEFDMSRQINATRSDNLSVRLNQRSSQNDLITKNYKMSQENIYSGASDEVQEILDDDESSILDDVVQSIQSLTTDVTDLNVNATDEMNAVRNMVKDQFHEMVQNLHESGRF